jgi:hypothetical protein
MRNLLHALSNSPTPYPSPTALDTSKVQPGAWYGVILTFLIVGLVVLLFSLNRHLKRVNFEKPED